MSEKLKNNKKILAAGALGAAGILGIGANELANKKSDNPVQVETTSANQDLTENSVIKVEAPTTTTNQSESIEPTQDIAKKQFFEKLSSLKEGDELNVAEGTFTINAGATVILPDGSKKIIDEPYVDVYNPAWADTDNGESTDLCFNAKSGEVICIQLGDENKPFIKAERQNSEDNSYYEVPISELKPNNASHATVSAIEGNGAPWATIIAPDGSKNAGYVAYEPESMDSEIN